jgi:predicted patatin/cPLA2 family phospholipase
VSKRSLILAGGGLKVAYQAGVLQVWLDEAGLSFDHADGASAILMFHEVRRRLLNC